MSLWGYIVLRGDPEKHFLDYDFCKQNSKILYSYHKKRMPSSLSGTFFNRHKMLFETGSLQTTFSNIFYFLHSATDRSKKINRYLESANLLPTDVPVSPFETEESVVSDPSTLDFASQDKEIMTGAVVKILKKIADMSNANLAKNADGLFSKLEPNASAEWIGKNKSRIP